MSAEVIMPKMGMGMETGTLIRWLKAPGDTVAANEPVAEIETDKATVELESPIAGTLGPHLVDEGEAVPVGTKLCDVFAPGEVPPAEGVSTSSKQDPMPVRPPGPGPKDKVRLTPSARRRARELGLDITEIIKNFPPGRVTRKQLEVWYESWSSLSTKSAARSPETPAATSTSEKEKGVTRIPLTPMRATIARRMVESLRSTAQLTLTTDVDVTGLINMRERLVPAYERVYGIKPSMTAFFARAMIRAVPHVPHVNSRWDGDAITVMDSVHLGVAVALDDGLIVPVLRDAQRLDFPSLNARLHAVIDKARRNQLTQDEAGSSTITLTNLGMYHVDAFTPILNPPEVAVLGVGRVRPAPVLQDGHWVTGYAVTLSLTIDHRVVDGAPGARFLQQVASLLSEPELLLLG